MVGTPSRPAATTQNAWSREGNGEEVSKIRGPHFRMCPLLGVHFTPPPPLLTPNSSFLTSMRRHLPLGRSPYPLSHFAAGVTLAPPLIRFIRFQATQHLRQSWYHKAALPNLCAATFIPNSSFLIFPAPPPSPRVKSVPPEPHRPKDVTLQPLYPFICLILL